MMAGVTGTRAVIAAVGVALVLGVAACSGSDPEPRIAPPSSSAPSSPSTSPAASSSPANTANDQEAFVRGYFESIGRATQSGDPSEFLAMSADSCGNCHVLAQNIEKAYGGRRYVEGADWAITRTFRAGERPEGEVWNVDVKTAKERWYDGSGDLVKIVDASTQHFGVIVSVDGDSYRIADMRLRS
jgi:hypothetical protein